MRQLVDEATALSFSHDEWWLILRADEEEEDGANCLAQMSSEVQANMGVLEAALAYFGAIPGVCMCNFGLCMRAYGFVCVCLLNSRLARAGLQQVRECQCWEMRQRARVVS